MEEQDEDSETESECSKSDVSEGEFHVRKTKSLYTIDFCSPLGQRVKNHMSKPGETMPPHTSIDTLCSYEKFCETPEKNLGDRLRSRGSGWPVSFKKTRRTDPKHWHLYAFTKWQRKDHYLKMKTGLNRASRALKCSMHKCSVVLKRLTKVEIKKWTSSPRKNMFHCFVPLTEVDLSSFTSVQPMFSDSDLDAEDAIFPGGPGLLSDPTELQRLLGLKTKTDLAFREKSPSPPLELSQVVSEDVNAEVNQQKVIVYRTLLSELSRRHHCLEQVPIPVSSPLQVSVDHSTDLTPPTTPEEQSNSSSSGSALYPTGLYRSANVHRLLERRQSDENLSGLQWTPNSEESLANTGPSPVPSVLGPSSFYRQDAKCIVSSSGEQRKKVPVTRKQVPHKLKIRQTSRIKTAAAGKNSVVKLKKANIPVCRAVVTKKPLAKGAKKPVISKTVNAQSAKSVKKKVYASESLGHQKKCKKKVVQKKKAKIRVPKTSIQDVQKKKASKIKSMVTRQMSHGSPAAGTRLKQTRLKKPEALATKSFASDITSAKPKIERQLNGRSTAGNLSASSSKKVQNLLLVSTRRTSGSSTVRGQNTLKRSETYPSVTKESLVPPNAKQSKKTAAMPDDNLSVSSSEHDSSQPVRKIRGVKRSNSSSRDSRPAKYTHKDACRVVPDSPTVPVLLFKCHVCCREIACQGKQFKEFIVDHFANEHNLYGIHLVEQKTKNGELIVSIVQGDSPVQPSIPSAGKNVNVAKKLSVGAPVRSTSTTPLTPHNNSFSKSPVSAGRKCRVPSLSAALGNDSRISRGKGGKIPQRKRSLPSTSTKDGLSWFE